MVILAMETFTLTFEKLFPKNYIAFSDEFEMIHR